MFFSGVGAILANSRCTSPAPRRRTTPKPQEPEVNIPGPDNTEMLIMGILRDKKEEKYHEAHNVSNLYHPLHKIFLLFEKKFGKSKIRKNLQNFRTQNFLCLLTICK